MKVKFTYRQIYGYIKDGKYPEVLEKCELVGKGPSFSRCMQEMHLYYTGGMFYVSVSLAIDPLLAKFNPLHPIAAKCAREISCPLHPIAAKCARTSLPLFIAIAAPFWTWG